MPTPSEWPLQPSATWPPRHLIENAAIHPTHPWLAVACTDTEAGCGSILVFDAQTGSLRSATPYDGYVGWSNPGLLRWHPDGNQLATNTDTNGITLLDRAEVVGSAFPDETRDGGVRYLWVGDALFTDTGVLVQIQPGDWRFDFEELEQPEAPSFQAIEWNAAKQFVVGRVGTGLVAYDPIARRVVYESTLAAFGDQGHVGISPDGRWCVRRQFAVHPAPDALLFVDGDTGQVHGLRHPSSPRIDDLAWSANGSLAVSSYVHHIGGDRTQRRLDIFRAGERVTVELGASAIQASHSIDDASGIAWSPTGDGVAVLLDGQRVQVLDAQTGAVLSSFHAPAPAIPAGLPDYYVDGHRPAYGFPGDLMWTHQQRLIRIAPHFVSVWSLDGTKLAEFVVSA